MAKISTVRILMLVLPLVLALGCAPADEELQPDVNPWSNEFRRALDRATSDFERAVLEDGEISEGEYGQAVDRFQSCARSEGLDIRAEMNSDGYYTYAVRGQPNDEVMDRCALGTVTVIAQLYVGMLTNPDNIDADELLVACLVSSRLAPEDFTVAHWRATESRFTFDTDTGEVLAEQQPTAQLPFDTDDPRFHGCMQNPSRD